MKFFLLGTDKGNHIPYSINKNRIIDIRYTDRRLLLTSRVFANVIDMYVPGTIFKIVFLLEYESGVNAIYHMPFLEEVDCLSDQTIKNHGGTGLVQIVMEEEKVAAKPIFRIAGYTHPYVIGRLDFVESILRRGVEGITLEEVFLV